MAYYYIDNVNGNDARTGLRIPAGDYNSTSYNTVDSSADTTHFVDAALTGANDYINGSFFYNVTRGAGSLISDFDAGTDTATLATPITGMAAGDSYYILDAWQNLAQYFSTTVRSPGDIAYVRANQTITLAAIVGADEDGDPTGRIYLKGCTSSMDPWHDGSNVKTMIDCNNGAYGVQLNGDTDWEIHNLGFKNNNNDTVGSLELSTTTYVLIKNCTFADAAHTTNGSNVTVKYGVQAIFEDCTFTNANHNNLYIIYGYLNLIRCTFNGGALTTNYGIYSVSSRVYAEDCTFGAATTHALADIYMQYSSDSYILKNCKLNSTPKLSLATWAAYGFVREISTQQVFVDQQSSSYLGVTSRDTSVVRVSGASSSAKMLPASSVSASRPWKLNCDMQNPDFRVWCAPVATTITVYVRGLNWSSYPTAAQLYLEAIYTTSTVTEAITRSTIASTQVLTDNTTWTALTVTFTPSVAGWVELNLWLKKYVATCGVYVDIDPVVS